jgi:anthranilate phosphoribosyltransferase
MIGVFAERLVEPIAQALKSLGTERALVVHGADGLDEITTTGPTHAAVLDKGKITRFTISPEEAGLTCAIASDLRGGSADENAVTLRAVLGGAKGPLRDIVCLNAAGALWVAERVSNLKDGVALAASAIDDGRALASLEHLIKKSQALKALGS